MTGAEIGHLRHPCELQESVRTPTGGGGADETWQTVATVFAEIKPRSGREVFFADGLEGEVTHAIRFRYRPGVEPDMRLKAGDRIFDIRSVRDLDERRRWLMCACREQRR